MERLNRPEDKEFKKYNDGFGRLIHTKIITFFKKRMNYKDRTQKESIKGHRWDVKNFLESLKQMI